MSAPLDFGGRVAVVTGAGRGLGRAYAELLRELGAHVLANDVDALDGVTHVGSVADPAHAQSLVDTAIEEHGRIDAVINNAGTVQYASMPDVDLANLDAHLDVHVRGTFNTIKAAWPHMTAAGYGRIVNTTSTGTLGLKGNLGYAAAKGAVIGMTRTLAVEGQSIGIKANCIAPAAHTRLAGDANPLADKMDPALAAPMVAHLAHEDCPVSGEIFAAGAGRFARLFLASTEGAVTDDVVGDWKAINDEGDYYVPQDLLAWSANFLKHLS